MRLLRGIAPFLKNGILGGIAVACYLKSPLIASLEEKPISLPPPPPSPQTHLDKHEYFHFFNPFGVEAPYYVPAYKGAIMSSLPYLVSLQQLWGAPGISISVMVKGDLVWSQAFGYADVENAVPLSTQSRMRIASISKAFTSVALGILYENGKIDLDEPIQSYLPQFPIHSHPHPITPRYLASHLAGIRHYLPDLKEFYSTTNFKTVHEAVEVIKSSELVAPPGTKFHYSTFGYTILSAVLEKASGQTYLALMQDKVFGPLDMLHTCHDEHNTVIPHRARHYIHEAPLRNSPYVDVSNKWAGGGFLSTTEDVARFGSALLRGSILKPETVRMLFTPQQTVAGKTTEYGLGWAIRNVPILHPSSEVATLPGAVFHTGGAVGASSILFMLPNSQVVVAIILNVQEVNGLYPCALRIAKAFERNAQQM